MMNKNIKRWKFGRTITAIMLLLCLALACCLAACKDNNGGDGGDGTQGGQQPPQKQATLSFAMLSDIHFQLEDKTATKNFRRAIEICERDSGGLDAVVVAGDLIDTPWWSKMIYEDEVIVNTNKTRYAEINNLRSELESIIPASAKLMYCLGNHDMATFKGTPGVSINSGTEYYRIFSESERDLLPEELHVTTSFANFSEEELHRYGVSYYNLKNAHFITLNAVKYYGLEDGAGAYSALQTEWLDETLAYINENHPTEPVFLITHMPVQDSVMKSSGSSGAVDLKSVLSKYPQTITVTGHIHQNTFSDLAISQDLGYTCIEGCSVKYTNVGSYNEQKSFDVKFSPESRSSSQGMLITVYDNSEVVISRYDFTNDKKAGADWVIPAIGTEDRLTRYSTQSRAKTNTAPYFDESATLLCEKTPSGNVLNVKFPQAKDDDNLVWAYRVTATYQSGGNKKELIADSGFALKNMPDQLCVSFDKADEIIKVSVIAEDALYKQSAALTMESQGFVAEGELSQATHQATQDYIGAVTIGGTRYAVSDQLDVNLGMCNSMQSMASWGSAYFNAFESNYEFSFNISNMRLNKASTVSGYAQEPYRLGAVLAAYEYNGRIYAICAGFDFDKYNANSKNEDKRDDVYQLNYYLVVTAPDCGTYVNVYAMTHWGVNGVAIEPVAKDFFKSEGGAAVTVKREGSVFRIYIGDLMIDERDLSGDYYYSGRYTRFTADTKSTFGINLQGAEALITNATYTL